MQDPPRLGERKDERLAFLFNYAKTCYLKIIIINRRRNQMTTHDLIDIVIAPDNILSEELTQKLATILGRDLYHTRALLSAKIPRIIFQDTRLQKVECILHQLETLGLVAFCYKDDELRQPLRLFKANSLEFAGSNIMFRDKSTQLFRLEEKNVFLILKGILRTHQEKEIITKVKKLNITATLMTGGIPIRRTIQEKTKEITTQNECLVRLFEKNSMHFCVEIKQHGFNYSCLGSDMSPSSLHNINLLANKIKSFFPEAIFEDNLGQFPPPSTSPLSPHDNIDIDCKLIYLYHQVKTIHRTA
jgi:hypothetical protein